ncbi:MAG: hypothetical protein ABSD98_12410 [Candidatus Korobacteraceae bacterium]|jgi:hypothetical protein
MTCPNCKSELSRVWQPKRASNVIVPVQWSCSICGCSFGSKQLRAGAKRQASAAPAQPELV